MNEFCHDDFSDGACTCCDVVGELRRGGLLSQPICPTCTITHQLAPDVLVNLLGMGLRLLDLDGVRVDLMAPTAQLQLARALTARHRKRGAAALFDWSNGVNIVPSTRSEVEV